MITIADYWMGRDAAYAAQCTSTIRAAGDITVARVNALLSSAAAAGMRPGINPQTHTAVSGGWRPPAINAATANAATHSTHTTAEACDVRDTADRALARWCLRNLDALEQLGLWMEDPRWTPTWVHLQTRAPGSGHRVFVPSSAPPLAAALPEQQA